MLENNIFIFMFFDLNSNEVVHITEPMINRCILDIDLYSKLVDYINYGLDKHVNVIKSDKNTIILLSLTNQLTLKKYLSIFDDLSKECIFDLNTNIIIDKYHFTNQLLKVPYENFINLVSRHKSIIYQDNLITY